MSAYESFAIVGAGTLGILIIEALAAKSVSLVVLSRPGSATKTVPPSVKTVLVDYDDAAAVTAVLEENKIDVVISTVAYEGLASQNSLVDAAKLAGVKLFVPSEFGFPTDGLTEGVLGAKGRFAAYLKSINMPSTRIFTGAWTDWIPWLVDYANGGKVKVIGKGEAQVSFTSIADMAGFVAYVLTNLPPSELEDRVLRIEGQRASLRDVAEQFKTEVVRVDSIGGDMGQIKTALQGLVEAGRGSSGWDGVKNAESTGNNAAGSANALWPGHHWESIKEVLNL
ncbi:hypothetical protein DFH08DRAFT_706477 [Mycena albidolilacea]|uniref:NmrA-like domain-containing protein n=1 Tax=Mycena albidolilacea TaxID=1033008 RepID=A0AAD6ZRK2_9AGAR|nr:hypothetical protein DFH08DRAFT_706477 [Mycena albidolilacea]